VLVALTALLMRSEQARADPAPVYLNAPFADRGAEPTEFSPNRGPSPGGTASLPGLGYVRGLTWTSWGGTRATGVGRVRLLNDRTSASSVTVTLGGLESCAGVMIYTSYSLELGVGAQRPRYWPSGQTGRFPCFISAGAYIPQSPLARVPEAQGSCVFHGLAVRSQGAPGLPWLVGTDETPDVKWSPHLPRGSAYSLFCRTQWTKWGEPIVTGRGVLRNGVKQWGVKVQLSQPAWCRQLGVAYNRLTMTVYGNGEPITGHGNISKGDANRLRGDIGRSGVGSRQYRQVEPPSADCGR
jgi:hypothetical protein